MYVKNMYTFLKFLSKNIDNVKIQIVKEKSKMANNISYSTDQMREWSDNMRNMASEYDNNIRALYQELESFIGSGFTGGLADEFLSSFQDKKKEFIENKNIIEECAKFINDRANKINSDEEEISNRIKNDNYFDIR